MDTLQSGLRFFGVLIICCVGMAFLGGCSTVVIRGRERPLLRHAPIRGDLEFVAEKRTDENKSTSNMRKSTTKIFEERLNLKTKGDLYHPNLLAYSAAIGLGLTQQRLNSNEQSGSTTGELSRYEVSVQILRNKPYNISFYVSRFDEILARQFLAPLEAEGENFGVSLGLRFKDWPMRFQYSKNEAKQQTLGASTEALDSFLREDERFRYLLAHDFGELGNMKFEFSRNKISQKRLGFSSELQEDRYLLLHDLVFGDSEQYNLHSFLNYLDQSNSSEIKSLEWEEYLTLNHSDTFLTNYRFRFTDVKRGESENKMAVGIVGFRHWLYKSLITTGNIYSSEAESNDRGESTARGANLNFIYRKKNPWGRLFAIYDIRHDETEQSSGAGGGTVVNEPHTVPTGVAIVELDKVNVDESSIIVRDSINQIFEEGDDYTIETVNGRVRLRIHIPPIGAAFPPNFTVGQQFFVTYDFFIDPKRKEETLRQRFEVRQRFNNGLSLYYERSWQNEDFSSAETKITPDEFTINTLGADYSNKGLGLSAEYSKKDSTVAPFTSKRLESRYTWPMNKDTGVAVYANSHWLDFGAPDEHDIRLFSAGCDLSSRLTDRMRLTAGIDYRDENDSQTGKTEGIQLNSELQYRYRKLQINTGLEYNILERSSNKTKNTFLYFRMKRVF